MSNQAYLFDMDRTLIDNDCDVSWKTFMVDAGLAEPHALEQAELFYRQYLEDRLDVAEFLRFQLAEFAGRTPAEMAELARQHFAAKVAGHVFRQARQAVAHALRESPAVAIVTSTNEVIAAPVAAALGIPEVVATRLELRHGRYTGNLDGVYCNGIGKVTCADRFCRAHGVALDQAVYYGDSLADVPLFSAVKQARAVNPVPPLAELARQNGWQILHWRQSPAGPPGAAGQD